MEGALLLKRKFYFFRLVDEKGKRKRSIISGCQVVLVVLVVRGNVRSKKFIS